MMMMGYDEKVSARGFAVQRLRSMVHEIVGRINGHYGTLTHVPIHHLDRQLAFHELCALYAVTDIALVTSLRDGMNLVSYEYVACQSDNAGKPRPLIEVLMNFSHHSCSKLSLLRLQQMQVLLLQYLCHAQRMPDLPGADSSSSLSWPWVGHVGCCTEGVGRAAGWAMQVCWC